MRSNSSFFVQSTGIQVVLSRFKTIADRRGYNRKFSKHESSATHHDDRDVTNLFHQPSDGVLQMFFIFGLPLWLALRKVLFRNRVCGAAAEHEARGG